MTVFPPETFPLNTAVFTVTLHPVSLPPLVCSVAILHSLLSPATSLSR